MDLSKLKPSDYLVGGGAIVFLISFFMPWYGIDELSGGESGADYLLTGWIPLLLILGVFALTVLPSLVEGVNIPDEIGPLARAQAALAGAGAAAVLVLLRLVIRADVEIPFSGDFKLDRKFGLFLALLAAIAVAAGAFMKSQEGDSGASSSQPPTPF